MDHLNPGDSIQRRFTVRNRSSNPEQVSLFVEAADIGDGQFRATGRQGDLPSWSSISPSAVRLSGNEAATATVRIDVPSDASGGERYGVVFAEIPPPEGVGVGVAQRVGFRIYLSVGGAEEPPTDFELPTFRPIRTDEGSPAVEIDACNTGGRAVDLTGSIELEDGPGGIKAGPFLTERATTLGPEQCDTFTIVLDPELPRGPWTAIARLRSGEEERQAEATITFPDEAGERGEKVETKEVTGTTGGRIALAIALLLLFIALGLLLFRLLRRRRRDRSEAEHAGSRA